MYITNSVNTINVEDLNEEFNKLITKLKALTPSESGSVIDKLNSYKISMYHYKEVFYYGFKIINAFIDKNIYFLPYFSFNYDTKLFILSQFVNLPYIGHKKIIEAACILSTNDIEIVLNMTDEKETEMSSFSKKHKNIEEVIENIINYINFLTPKAI